MKSFVCRQVFDCKTMQLLQKRSFAGPDTVMFAAPDAEYDNSLAAGYYHTLAALPAGRIAAAKFGGIDVLAFQMAGPELAPARDACWPEGDEKTALWRCDPGDRCAAYAMAMQGLMEHQKGMRKLRSLACKLDGSTQQHRNGHACARGALALGTMHGNRQHALAQDITCMLKYTLPMRRMVARHMEYSLRSNCVVTLYGEQQAEAGEEPAPTAYDTAVTVLDVGAGGRMLCRLVDPMCALCNPWTLRSPDGLHQATHPMPCAGRTTRSRRSHCWTEAQAVKW